MMLRRRRLRDVIERQFDLFEREHADEIAETQKRLHAYNAAERDEAEELYGDYADSVDWVKDLLEEVRDAYSRTLDDNTRDAYGREFERMLGKRWPRVAF